MVQWVIYCVQVYRIKNSTLLYCLYPDGSVKVRTQESVCLCARLHKNACMNMDEMLRVDRYQDMDELINF